MKGLIFNIKRYAIHDGPGIRVTIFLKGCPLLCLWCHNPEGISPLAQIVERVDRIGEKEFRVKETVGRDYSVVELLDIVNRDRIFIDESGGGITFSGGEPLMQPDFLKEALKQFKISGIHTAVDTSGYAKREVIDSILETTDLFLFDIKHIDPVKHREYTGKSNKLILENYRYIINSGKKVNLRFPVIPGFNDDSKHIENVINFIGSTSGGSIDEIDLLPYHKIGRSKYGKFGLDYKMAAAQKPTSERMEELRILFSKTGIRTKIGG